MPNGATPRIINYLEANITLDCFNGSTICEGINCRLNYGFIRMWALATIFRATTVSIFSMERKNATLFFRIQSLAFELYNMLVLQLILLLTSIFFLKRVLGKLVVFR